MAPTRSGSSLPAPSDGMLFGVFWLMPFFLFGTMQSTEIESLLSAIINRCGLNSVGILAVARRLGVQHGKRKLDETSSSSSTSNDEVKHGGKAGPGILGVKIGKNKTSEDASVDYVQGVYTLSQYADYLVINISSPNTTRLRKLQVRKQLKDLVKKRLRETFLHLGTAILQWRSRTSLSFMVETVVTAIMERLMFLTWMI